MFNRKRIPIRKSGAGIKKKFAMVRLPQNIIMANIPKAMNVIAPILSHFHAMTIAAIMRYVGIRCMNNAVRVSNRV